MLATVFCCGIASPVFAELVTVVASGRITALNEFCPSFAPAGIGTPFSITFTYDTEIVLGPQGAGVSIPPYTFTGSLGASTFGPQFNPAQNQFIPYGLFVSGDSFRAEASVTRDLRVMFFITSPTAFGTAQPPALLPPLSTLLDARVFFSRSGPGPWEPCIPTSHGTIESLLPTGSTADADSDEVADTRDQCPSTAPGVPVDTNGCSGQQVDTDGDGICNPGVVSSWCSGSDVCPLDPADLCSQACRVRSLAEVAKSVQAFEDAAAAQQPAPLSSLISPAVLFDLDWRIANVEIQFPSITRESGFRPEAYQFHFEEIARADRELRALVNPSDQTRCEELLIEVIGEINRHRIRRNTRTGNLAVSSRGAHTFVPARAVDLNVPNPNSEVYLALDRLELARPCATDSAFHVALKSDGQSVCTSRVIATAQSPIALLLTDPLGRRIGFEPNTQVVINEIGPGASYTGVQSEPQVIDILEALPGRYSLSAVGTGFGPYKLSLERVSEHGDTIDLQRTEGNAVEGETYSLAQDVPLGVSIDVWPGIKTNPVYVLPNGQGLVTVGIVSTETLDARRIDTSTVTFGATGKERSLLGCAVADITRDSRRDLMCVFSVGRSGLVATSTQVVLRGATRDGFKIEGTDWVDVKVLKR
jgi:hypothetical protein